MGETNITAFSLHPGVVDTDMTKYLEVFAAAELAKRETNITAFSLHPGGDSGLGYETALALASAKAKVILACRSQTKCPVAAANITHATGNKDVSVTPLDLSSFHSVRLCAAAIRKQVSRIDALINNAGLPTNPKGIPTKTDDGFDRVFQVNFLGQQLLVRELLPLLRESNARVINVASIASLGACQWGNYLPGCTNLANLPKVARTSPTGLNLAIAPASNYGMTKYLEVFAAAELAVAEKDELANGKYVVGCKMHMSVRDLHADLHGEEATLSYQKGIHDMADDLLDATGSANHAKIMV